jgi:nitrogen fixation protein NifB
LNGQRGPTPQELKKVQDACEGGAKLMRHCRQCRADAVGLLGEDRGQEFTLDQLPEEVSYDPAKREAYREVVAKERGDHVAAKTVAIEEVKASAAESLLVAIATKGGGRINEHFGHAKEFQVYEVGAKGIGFVGHRKVDQYCLGGFGEDATLDGVIAALEGVNVVLCAKIGDCPKDMLTAAGIEASDDFAFEYIEPSLAEAYRRKFGAVEIAQSA